MQASLRKELIRFVQYTGAFAISAGESSWQDENTKVTADYRGE